MVGLNITSTTTTMSGVHFSLGICLLNYGFSPFFEKQKKQHFTYKMVRMLNHLNKCYEIGHFEIGRP